MAARELQMMAVGGICVYSVIPSLLLTEEDKPGLPPFFCLTDIEWRITAGLMAVSLTPVGRFAYSPS